MLRMKGEAGLSLRFEIAMNILIVESRYHPAIADALVDGATGALEKGGARFERVSVPGVLEVPAAIALAVRSARPFDGYVALGCVLGDNPVADTLYRETMHALTLLGAQGIVIGNAILLGPDEDYAGELAQAQDAGGDAGRACLSLVTLGERLGLPR
jgi:6,7-dimethyl-8-ribityllumazine synthase